MLLIIHACRRKRVTIVQLILSNHDIVSLTQCSQRTLSLHNSSVIYEISWKQRSRNLRRFREHFLS